LRQGVPFSETSWGVGYPLSKQVSELADGRVNWKNVAVDAGVWAGSAFTLGQKRNPRLGQWLPPSVVDDLAKALAEAAVPGIKDIVREERVRISAALLSGLPLVGASATLLLATYFLVPPKAETLRFSGYAGGWLLFVAGLARSLFLLSRTEEA
jgi:hypothetical protein